ncbi:hypothetical protein BKA70DRAFT_11831 [Coprinopsis sp. MPI-PUGE-AT-0042]|nr:hypothetical protein BKA70DRAFT_792576 [Coprinopsis sp. MPI-PUGE-AT-0042]KAH6918264.1 hypothetical protein BKA70DRAFT_11831 [Coprinopsis sp. MPI-PUGE-AT-0042]
MRFSGVALVSVLALAAGAVARSPYEDLLDLVTRSNGDCTGTGSSSTGSSCESNSSAVGFIADGESKCVTKKEAGGSVYKHKKGKCYQPKASGSGSGGKKVRFARRELEELLEELVARSNGDCTGTGSSSTGSSCESNSSAVGFIADGESKCITKKEAGGSIYKHKKGKCYQPKASGSGSGGKKVRFARREFDGDELVVRSNGDCTGTGSSSTGSSCESNSSAVGFIADGESKCITKKEAGGSIYKHKKGKCYQPKASGSGSGGKKVRFARRGLGASRW